MISELQFFLVGLFIILLFALISNTSAAGLNNIQHQLFIATCPMPVANAIDNLYIYHSHAGHSDDITTVQYGNFTYAPSGNGFGTFYQCITTGANSVPPNANEINIAVKAYNQTTVNFPSGSFVFGADCITIASQRAMAGANLLAYILTPINFNVLGHTISEVGGLGAFFIITLYIFAYLGIILFLISKLRSLLPTPTYPI